MEEEEKPPKIDRQEGGQRGAGVRATQVVSEASPCPWSAKKSVSEVNQKDAPAPDAALHAPTSAAFALAHAHRIDSSYPYWHLPLLPCPLRKLVFP